MRFFVEIDCNTTPGLRNKPQSEVADMLIEISNLVRNGSLALGKTLTINGKEAGQIVCMAYFKRERTITPG